MSYSVTKRKQWMLTRSAKPVIIMFSISELIRVRADSMKGKCAATVFTELKGTLFSSGTAGASLASGGALSSSRSACEDDRHG